MLLVAVGHADCGDLLAFELDNRAFFEGSIKPRAAQYYSHAGVSQAIDDAIDDAAAGRGYQFLVKSGHGGILGRINLRDVAHGAAVLGYRIGASHVRQGHASAAVRAVLAIAFDELGLRRIVAGSRATNPGSIVVLQRNGFTRLDGRDDTVELNGQVHAHWYFERQNEALHFAPASGMSRHP